jgi:hypothetical protein
MSGRRALAAGVGVVVVFVGSLVIGNALGDDERPAAPVKQAKTTVLGPLRLEPAPRLPELRAVRVKPKPAPAAPARPAPVAPAEPVAESADVPVETGGHAAPTPAPPVSSSPPAEPTPAAPPPPSEPPPPTTDAPQSAAPAPDPAPAPAPVPTPDPSPNGGSGQYSGP